MSKWGLTNGVAAGWIIRDLVLGGEAAVESSKYARMVDARRWDLLKAAPSIAKASVHTAAHMVGDKIKAAMSSDISKLKPGEGGLCKVKGETVGAYLDAEGKYHLVKPICTHLGCEVVFNQGDKCWSDTEQSEAASDSQRQAHAQPKRFSAAFADSAGLVLFCSSSVVVVCRDCPCHGSQFAIDGSVIQGPACKRLPSMNHLEW